MIGAFSSPCLLFCWIELQAVPLYLFLIVASKTMPHRILFWDVQSILFVHRVFKPRTSRLSIQLVIRDLNNLISSKNSNSLMLAIYRKPWNAELAWPWQKNSGTTLSANHQCNHYCLNVRRFIDVEHNLIRVSCYPLQYRRIQNRYYPGLTSIRTITILEQRHHTKVRVLTNPWISQDLKVHFMWNMTKTLSRVIQPINQVE